MPRDPIQPQLYRNQRVTQAEGLPILAMKRAGQKALAAKAIGVRPHTRTAHMMEADPVNPADPFARTRRSEFGNKPK